MRLIDADALEQDGWCMNRIIQIDEKTMEYQTRKPTDFPTIEPKRGDGLNMRIEQAGIAPNVLLLIVTLIFTTVILVYIYMNCKISSVLHAVRI